MFGNESEHSSVQNSIMNPYLNLLDGYWFVTASITQIPAEIKFLDDGTFVVTVKDESDNVKETYIGTYTLDVTNHTLEMDLNSTVVMLSLYDVQTNSFSGSSVKHDLLMSFQRRF
jgi:DeoR/GlpR family transcriptional regulator of sugar metabolism